ncbi:hypothetical protein [Lichenifustis flavocetrariae]|uniref:Uncharacterized protein n=1 Tax=Lichenifustis flavocetrariae TaxID=2949735 RepID=A0AA41Z2R0_9HYPH|nr:hypothetical protein [Lichenifustis flavocetrariae]MCW6513146.1 hypothetical protein [Lichenifustis flavocetrariae]
MATIGNHRNFIAPVPPPLPVGASASMTIGSRCLPHQMNQAKFNAIRDARAPFCMMPTSTPKATSTATTSGWQ